MEPAGFSPLSHCTASAHCALAGTTISGDTREEIVAGLRSLEQLQRSLDATRSELLGRLARLRTDTAASVAAALDVSVQTVRERMNLAAVVGAVSEASAMLAAGVVAADHLRLLRELVAEDQPGGPDIDGAAVLLGRCVTERLSPKDLRAEVMNYVLSRGEKTVSAKQRAMRSLKFFEAEHGCIGARIVLPAVEGTEFKNLIRQIANRAYRAAHPERARTLGGHRTDPLHQRYADALVALVRGDTGESKRSGGVNRKPAVIATISLETLQADLVGYGPVPLIDVLGLADTADLYYAIVTGKNYVLDLGRTQRLGSWIQKIAASIRDGGCTESGCDEPAIVCETDHIREWADGGLTDYANLELKCGQHHRVKTRLQGSKRHRTNRSTWTNSANPAIKRKHRAQNTQQAVSKPIATTRAGPDHKRGGIGSAARNGKRAGPDDTMNFHGHGRVVDGQDHAA